MSERPAPKPDDMPRLTPYLLCEDVAAEIAFLARAFGFEEHRRQRVRPDPQGPIFHAEVAFRDALVMMGWPGPDYRNPRHLGSASVMLYVYVDDVDAHHAHAKAAGAKILEAPADAFYGDRRYTAEDAEGHHWTFATRTRTIEPEDWVLPTDGAA